MDGKKGGEEGGGLNRGQIRLRIIYENKLYYKKLQKLRGLISKA